MKPRDRTNGRAHLRLVDTAVDGGVIETLGPARRLEVGDDPTDAAWMTGFMWGLVSGAIGATTIGWVALGAVVLGRVQ